MTSIKRLVACTLAALLLLSGCSLSSFYDSSEPEITVSSLEDIPDFDGSSPYVVWGDGNPEFDESDQQAVPFETYSPLDEWGRCGVAYACLGQELMPTEERGSIGQVRPSGWQTVKYDCVDGKYLYNRCHLIGFQLAGENANEQNLITGTRYLNVEGMLPFENMVADYIRETNYHVLYRVTPLFVGDELVARGVRMEAWSVEDNGEGICFDVFCYNNQPGVEIDYATGDSRLSEWGFGSTTESNPSTTAAESTTETSTNSTTVTTVSTENPAAITYILNTNSKKFHLSTCSSAKKIGEANREEWTGDREELVASGYTPCGSCQP